MATKKTEAPDLLQGPVNTTLLQFSLPFMLSTLLQTLYSTADTIVVGQCLGSHGLSAVSNGSLLMQLLYMLCVGFASAGQVLISQAVGANNKEKLQKIIHALFILEVLFGVLTGGICVLFSKPLLRAMNTPDSAFVQASYYVTICGIGMIFTALYNMFSAILRGYGDSRHPMIFVLIASVINIILDIFFIAFFHWNVAGAALATIIGQLCSVLFSFYYCKINADKLAFSLQLRSLNIDRKSILQLLKLGLPLALQSGAVQFSFLFVNSLVNSLGVTISAAFGVSQKIRNIPSILCQALGTGCTSMVGQNWGAHKSDRVSSTIRWGLLYTLLVETAFGLLFWFAPYGCFRLFTQDPEVLSYAPLCIFALIIELPGQVLMPPCCSLINAQGFVQFSIIIGFLDAFVGRVFLSWFLGVFLNLGALGFFLGYALATYFTAIPVFIYYISGLWKRRKVLI